MELKFKFEKDTPANFASFMGRLWQKAHITIFFVTLLVAIFLGFYIWQQSLNGSGWSQQQQQDYLNTHGSGVVFKEAEFNKAISDIQARSNYASTYQPLKDIFTPYK